MAGASRIMVVTSIDIIDVIISIDPAATQPRGDSGGLSTQRIKPRRKHCLSAGGPSLDVDIERNQLVVVWLRQFKFFKSMEICLGDGGGNDVPDLLCDFRWVREEQEGRIPVRKVCSKSERLCELGGIGVNGIGTAKRGYRVIAFLLTALRAKPRLASTIDCTQSSRSLRKAA